MCVSVSVCRTLHIRAYRRRQTQQPSNTDVIHTDSSPLQHGDFTGADDVTADVDGLNDDVMLRVFGLLSLRDRMRCQRGNHCNDDDDDDAWPVMRGDGLIQHRVAPRYVDMKVDTKCRI